VGLGTGHFFGAMRIDAFQPADVFKKRMDLWIETFKNAPAVEGKRVLIPGEPERFAHEERLQTGIPLIDKVVQDLEVVGDKFGIVL
jgi:LDH2 family malate/lactate/ureidoglycolate dehydrogenase